MPENYKIFPTTNDIASVEGRGNRFYEFSMADWLKSFTGRNFVYDGGEFSAPASGLTVTVPAVKCVIEGRLVEIYDSFDVLCDDDASNKIWIQLLIDESGNATGFQINAVSNGTVPENAVYIGTAVTEDGDVIEVELTDRDNTPYAITPQVLHRGEVEGMGYEYSSCHETIGLIADYWGTYKHYHSYCSDGSKFYVFGGRPLTWYDNGEVTEIGMFNYTTKEWTVPKNTAQNISMAVTGYNDGYIYVLGGVRCWRTSGAYYATNLSTAKKIKVSDMSISNLTDLPKHIKAIYPSSFCCVGNRIYFASMDANEENKVEYYDLSTGSISSVQVIPTLNGYRVKGYSLANINGDLYVFGGVSLNNEVSNKAYVLNVETGAWVERADLPSELALSPLGTTGYLLVANVDQKGYLMREMGHILYEYDPVLNSYAFANYAPINDSGAFVGSGTGEERYGYFFKLSEYFYHYSTGERWSRIKVNLMDSENYEWSLPVRPPMLSGKENNTVIAAGSIVYHINQTTLKLDVSNSSLTLWARTDETIPASLQGVGRLGACYHGNCLYFLGGRGITDGIRKGVFVKYSIDTDSYTALTYPSTIGGDTIGNRDDYILVSTQHYLLCFGGKDSSDNALTKPIVYNCITDVWSRPTYDFGEAKFPAIFAFDYNGVVFVCKETSGYKLMYRIDDAAIGPVTELAPNNLPISGGVDYRHYHFHAGKKLYLIYGWDRGADIWYPRVIYSFIEVDMPLVGTHTVSRTLPYMALQTKRWENINQHIRNIQSDKGLIIFGETAEDLWASVKVIHFASSILVTDKPGIYSIRDNKGEAEVVNITTGERGETVSGLAGDEIGVFDIKFLPSTLDVRLIGG